MTRIFDALKKTQASRPAPELTPRPAPAPVAPVPPPEPGRGGSPIARAMRPGGREGAPRSWTEAAEFRPMVVPIREAYPLPAEVVREMTKLRVSLEALLLERATRAIIFLGSQAGEGTTTVAYQFAFTLARDPRIRTLFVDAHARRPSLHAAGGGTQDAAGADVAADANEGVRTRPGLAASLSPESAGTSERAGAVDAWPLAEQFQSVGLLSPDTVRAAIDWGATAYDWIVMDGPSVLESPDAAPIAAVADGAVMVVEAGRTKKPVLQRSVDLLRKAGARTLGSVLNRRRLEIPGFIYRRI